jgi:hypothetical protein
MEVNWFASVGSRKTYVAFIVPPPRPLTATCRSGLGEERAMVCDYGPCRLRITYVRLSSTIIKDIMILRDRGFASAAYFYFDFRDTSKQNRRDLLLSLIFQLSACSSAYHDILCRLHLDHDSGAQAPSEDALITCLKEMVKLLDQPPVYVIIDALDECPNSSGMPSPREQVLDFLKGLVKLSLSNLHLCVTSRREIDIQYVLEPLASRRVSLHDQSGQKKDIVAYVTSVVNSDSMMQRWRDEDKRLVIETLSERANGM